MTQIIVDLQRFNKITGEDPELRREILALFFQNVARCCAMIAMNINSDNNIWRNSLHELKGAADNIGMRKIGDICKGLEATEYLTEEEKILFIGQIEENAEEIRNYFSDLYRE